MHPIHPTSLPPATVAGPSAERPPAAAPRTLRVAKSFPPVVTGNRAYIHAWAARRAKLAAAAKTRAPG